MPSPVCFRLSTDELEVIDIHASDLTVSKGRTVDRTEALKDIIQQFNQGKHTLVARLKTRFHPRNSNNYDRPPEQKNLFPDQTELVNDQLQEALH